MMEFQKSPALPMIDSRVRIFFGALALLGASMAWAQAPGSDARAASERAACNGNQQDRAACLREAGAAQAAARHGALTAAPDQYQQNALQRCQAQPTAERAECEARITGAGASSSQGSVMGGGVLRETVTPIAVPASPRQ